MENPIYAKKVKITNLQQMSRTLAFLQENRIGSLVELNDLHAMAESDADTIHSSLLKVESNLKKVKILIRNQGQYFAYRSVYHQYLQADNKAIFRTEHETELLLYEGARKVLRNEYGSRPFPSRKELLLEKGTLQKERNRLYEEDAAAKSRLRSIERIGQNVHAILEPVDQREHLVRLRQAHIHLAADGDVLVVLLQTQKLGNAKVTDLKPKELKIYFTKGEAFKVPVRLVEPHIQPKEHYTLMKTEVTPDSVTVYAIKSLADQIKAVDINYFTLNEETDGNEKTVRMPYKAGVKYQPKEVTVKVTTDLLTEDTMRVRITVPEMGNGLLIRTFPPSVTVRYSVPVSRKKEARSIGFVVVPNADQAVLENDSVLDIMVSESPAFVFNPRLDVRKVGFLKESR